MLDKKTQEQAATYVSTTESCSIISDEALDFRVRNGAGYFHLSVTTCKLSKEDILIYSLYSTQVLLE